MLIPLFLLLPTLASTGIYITVHTGKNAFSAWMQAEGDFYDVISEKEELTFGLENSKLLDAAQHFTEGVYQAVFIRRPIPDDPYPNHYWAEVARVIKPIESELYRCGLGTRGFSVSRKNYTRHGVTGEPIPVELDFSSLKANVETSYQVKWLTRQGSFDIKDEMVFFLKGSVNMSFTLPWGTQSGLRTRTSMVKAARAIENVTLRYGQVPRADLFVTEGTVRFLIDYEATLSGAVAGHWYPIAIKSHKPPLRHNLEINSLLRKANIPEKLWATQYIKIHYHYDPRIVITDCATEVTIAVIPAAFIN